MRYTWITDIHLNFLGESRRAEFYAKLAHDKSNIILLSGDIAEAPSVCRLLDEMALQVKKKIYYVLGNHDYYRGSIAEIRHDVHKLSISRRNLIFLTMSPSTNLSPDTFLLGVDGWADAQYGDYDNSKVALNDQFLIEDLKAAWCKGRPALKQKMIDMASHDTEQLLFKLKSTVKHKPKRILIVTHIPPFRETCLHEGMISDDNFLPFFGNKTMGDMLLQFAERNKKIKLAVLCGHTHSKAQYFPLLNLSVYAGHAEYHHPDSQGTFELEEL